MHLMYTLNDNGDRVYTLKVSIAFFLSFPDSTSHKESDNSGCNSKVRTPRFAQFNFLLPGA